MKIVTIVGARPQFIKAAVVSHELRKNHKEVLVHTGQHFDYNMSETFFDELSIPKPDYNLGISGGTHAEMTGQMMISVEKVLNEEKPDWVLVYGDTNSTLAAALAAAKLHIRICHVEAGARTYSRTNPEEINRICTDHISSLLLTSTESGLGFLAKEGLSERSYMVGDPMYDAFVEYSNRLSLEDITLASLEGKMVKCPMEYYYLTCHREENTKKEETLYEILKAMNSMEIKTVYPVHPRNRKKAQQLVVNNNFSNIILCEPVGYLESTSLVRNAKKVVTDSGGLQREAFFAGKQCITILDFVCWPETMVGGRNVLSKPNADEIISKLNKEQIVDNSYNPFGDGHASERIVRQMENYKGN